MSNQWTEEMLWELLEPLLEYAAKEKGLSRMGRGISKRGMPESGRGDDTRNPFNSFSNFSKKF